MIKYFLLNYFFLFFYIEISCGQQNYGGIFMEGDSPTFTQSDFQSYSKLPPAFQSILNNDLGTIEKMPKQELEKKYRNRNVTFSSLMYACKYGYGREGIANFLIDNNVDVNFRNQLGETALSYLAFSKSQDTVLAKRLMTQSTFYKKDIHGLTPLFYSVYSNNFEMFKYLLKEYLKNNKAAGSNELEKCFNYAFNIHDEHDNSLIFLEKICETINIREIYWKNGLYKRPIDEAIIRTQLYNGITRLYGIDSTHLPKDDSLDIKLMDILMKHGLNINEVFEEKQSILYKVYENKPLVKFLSTKIANINQLDSTGETFLQYYIQQSITPPKIKFNGKSVYLYGNERDYIADFDVINYLINAGFEVNKPYKDGILYLIITAIDKKNYFIIKDLFKKYPELLKKPEIIKVLKELLDSKVLNSIISP